MSEPNFDAALNEISNGSNFEPELREFTTTFDTEFGDAIALYRGVVRVWIGDGTTGTDGVLYAEMVDGVVQEVGPVTAYYYALENGYQGTFAEWVQLVLDTSDNAQSAAQSAADALASEQAAASSESNASTYAGNALTSAGNAATSESNAATSATNASASESNARASELNAADYAQVATNKANSIKNPVTTVTYQNSDYGDTIPSGEWTSSITPVKGKYTWTKIVITWADLTTSTFYDVSYIGRDGDDAPVITDAQIDALFA